MTFCRRGGWSFEGAEKEEGRTRMNVCLSSSLRRRRAMKKRRRGKSGRKRRRSCSAFYQAATTSFLFDTEKRLSSLLVEAEPSYLSSLLR